MGDLRRGRQQSRSPPHVGVAHGQGGTDASPVRPPAARPAVLEWGRRGRLRRDHEAPLDAAIRGPQPSPPRTRPSADASRQGGESRTNSAIGRRSGPRSFEHKADRLPHGARSTTLAAPRSTRTFVRSSRGRRQSGRRTRDTRGPHTAARRKPASVGRSRGPHVAYERHAPRSRIMGGMSEGRSRADIAAGSRRAHRRHAMRRSVRARHTRDGPDLGRTSSRSDPECAVRSAARFR